VCIFWKSYIIWVGQHFPLINRLCFQLEVNGYGELWIVHSLVWPGCFFFIFLAAFMQLEGSTVEVMFVNNNSNLFRLN